MALLNPTKTYNLSFSKYSGAGNDFILVDDRDLHFPSHDKHYIQHLCHRQLGIGADGVILLQNSTCANFLFRIFNADGSEAEMCGNGVRCFGKFLQELGIEKPFFTLQTMHRIIDVAIMDDQIRVDMGLPEDILWNMPLSCSLGTLKVHFLNTGVPHLIVFVEDLENINIATIGKELRFHDAFKPRGTNVNFVTISKNQEVYIRTYERGVEAETLACGTGATAAALAAHTLYQLPTPLKVHTRSKEILIIECAYRNNELSQVLMSGSAQLVFKGVTS